MWRVDQFRGINWPDLETDLFTNIVEGVQGSEQHVCYTNQVPFAFHFLSSGVPGPYSVKCNIL